jgi:hypothetical protein
MFGDDIGPMGGFQFQSKKDAKKAAKAFDGYLKDGGISVILRPGEGSDVYQDPKRIVKKVKVQKC